MTDLNERLLQYNDHMFFGQWRLDGETPEAALLGKGSFGRVYSVYRVEKDSFGKQIRYMAAVKVIAIDEVNLRLSATMDKETKQKRLNDELRFVQKEIEIMRRLEGESNIAYFQKSEIIRRTDTELDSWDVLICMEKLVVLRKQLAALNLTPGTFPFFMQIMYIWKEISIALSVCEKSAILHVDVKPDNIFYAPGPDHYKLSDFGTSIIGNTFRSGIRYGTNDYMSPEMYHRKGGDSRADLYSLAVMIYELLNGNVLPFQTNMNREGREAAWKTRLLDLKTVPALKGVPDDVNQVLLRCLDVDPKRRYARCSDVADIVTEMYLQYKHKGGLDLKKKKKSWVIPVISVALAAGILGIGITIAVKGKKSPVLPENTQPPYVQSLITETPVLTDTSAPTDMSAPTDTPAPAEAMVIFEPSMSVEIVGEPVWRDGKLHVEGTIDLDQKIENTVIKLYALNQTWVIDQSDSTENGYTFAIDIDVADAASNIVFLSGSMLDETEENELCGARKMFTMPEATPTPTPGPTPEPPLAPITAENELKYVKAIEFAFTFEKPSDRYTPNGTVNAGEEYILQGQGEGWFELFSEEGGTIFYAHDSFFEIIPTETATPVPEVTPQPFKDLAEELLVKANKEIILYSEADEESTAAGNLSEGNIGRVTKENDAWYYVECEGVFAYVRKSSVSEYIPQEKLLEISFEDDYPEAGNTIEGSIKTVKGVTESDLVFSVNGKEAATYCEETDDGFTFKIFTAGIVNAGENATIKVSYGPDRYVPSIEKTIEFREKVVLELAVDKRTVEWSDGSPKITGTVATNQAADKLMLVDGMGNDLNAEFTEISNGEYTFEVNVSVTEGQKVIEVRAKLKGDNEYRSNRCVIQVEEKIEINLYEFYREAEPTQNGTVMIKGEVVLSSQKDGDENRLRIIVDDNQVEKDYEVVRGDDNQYQFTAEVEAADSARAFEVQVVLLNDEGIVIAQSNEQTILKADPTPTPEPEPTPTPVPVLEGITLDQKSFKSDETRITISGSVSVSGDVKKENLTLYVDNQKIDNPQWMQSGNGYGFSVTQDVELYNKSKIEIKVVDERQEVKPQTVTIRIDKAEFEADIDVNASAEWDEGGISISGTIQSNLPLDSIVILVDERRVPVSDQGEYYLYRQKAYDSGNEIVEIIAYADGAEVRSTHEIEVIYPKPEIKLEINNQTLMWSEDGVKLEGLVSFDQPIDANRLYLIVDNETWDITIQSQQDGRCTFTSEKKIPAGSREIDIRPGYTRNNGTKVFGNSKKASVAMPELTLELDNASIRSNDANVIISGRIHSNVSINPDKDIAVKVIYSGEEYEIDNPGWRRDRDEFVFEADLSGYWKLIENTEIYVEVSNKNYPQIEAAKAEISILEPEAFAPIEIVGLEGLRNYRFSYNQPYNTKRITVKAEPNQYLEIFVNDTVILSDRIGENGEFIFDLYTINLKQEEENKIKVAYREAPYNTEKKEAEFVVIRDSIAPEISVSTQQIDQDTDEITVNVEDSDPNVSVVLEADGKKLEGYKTKENGDQSVFAISGIDSLALNNNSSIIVAAKDSTENSAESQPIQFRRKLSGMHIDNLADLSAAFNGTEKVSIKGTADKNVELLFSCSGNSEIVHVDNTGAFQWPIRFNWLKEGENEIQITYSKVDGIDADENERPTKTVYLKLDTVSPEFTLDSDMIMRGTSEIEVSLLKPREDCEVQLEINGEIVDRLTVASGDSKATLKTKREALKEDSTIKVIAVDGAQNRSWKSLKYIEVKNTDIRNRSDFEGRIIGSDNNMHLELEGEPGFHLKISVNDESYEAVLDANGECVYDLTELLDEGENAVKIQYAEGKGYTGAVIVDSMQEIRIKRDSKIPEILVSENMITKDTTEITVTASNEQYGFSAYLYVDGEEKASMSANEGQKSVVFGGINKLGLKDGSKLTIAVRDGGNNDAILDLSYSHTSIKKEAYAFSRKTDLGEVSIGDTVPVEIYLLTDAETGGEYVTFYRVDKEGARHSMRSSGYKKEKLNADEFEKYAAQVRKDNIVLADTIDSVWRYSEITIDDGWSEGNYSLVLEAELLNNVMEEMKDLGSITVKKNSYSLADLVVTAPITQKKYDFAIGLDEPLSREFRKNQLIVTGWRLHAGTLKSSVVQYDIVNSSNRVVCSKTDLLPDMLTEGYNRKNSDYEIRGLRTDELMNEGFVVKLDLSTINLNPGEEYTIRLYVAGDTIDLAEEQFLAVKFVINDNAKDLTADLNNRLKVW